MLEHWLLTLKIWKLFQLYEVTMNKNNLIKLNDDEGRCPKCGAALPTGSVHSKDFCDFVWALGNFQDNAVLREVKENE